VATDDERIARAAERAGAEVRMTPADLPSGSDRVAHVLGDPGEDELDLVVNIQGDEPLLPGEAMDRAVDALVANPDAAMSTLAVAAGPDELDDPNVVKMVLDSRGRALYFSRSRIPHGGAKDHGFLKHVGLYVFKPAYLKHFVALGPGKLEQAEKLEQLRALEDGASIAVAVGEWPIQSVDTPQDLVEAERKVVAMSGRR
jgi:3-deoxy-manno-octulosonate cytidylyltransferase (CMP-KDO synthetase)